MPAPEHNRLMRRLMRRLPFTWPSVAIGAIGALFGLAPAMCVLAAGAPGAGMHVLAQVCRWLWLALTVLPLPVMVMTFLFTFTRPSDGKLRTVRTSILKAGMSTVPITVFLIVGRLDLAIYWNYGAAGISSTRLLAGGLRSARWNLAALNALVVLSFVFGPWWLAGSLALVLVAADGSRVFATPSAPSRSRGRLGAALAGKPSLDEYVAVARASCPVGGG